MIIIKSQEEIDIMRESGKITAFILSELSNVVRPGISTKEIDEFVEGNHSKKPYDPQL